MIFLSIFFNHFSNDDDNDDDIFYHLINQTFFDRLREEEEKEEKRRRNLVFQRILFSLLLLLKIFSTIASWNHDNLGEAFVLEVNEEQAHWRTEPIIFQDEFSDEHRYTFEVITSGSMERRELEENQIDSMKSSLVHSSTLILMNLCPLTLLRPCLIPLLLY